MTITFVIVFFALMTAVEGLSFTPQRSSFRGTDIQRIGVLSQGNYDTIHHILPNAIPVIASSTEHLYQLVENDQVDIGLISGIPDSSRFDSFPSGAISPRAIMTRKDDHATRQLMDAAIVRLQRSGLLDEYAQKHAPFEYVEVHMCRSVDPDKHLPFSVHHNNQSLIRMGALGPYNWHQDGDYTQNPPVGFWPSFYDGIDEILVNHTLMRKWFSSSAQVMDALMNGEIDATEGYWTVDSFYKDRPRTWSFDAGCTTLGYESNFFVKATTTMSNSSDISVMTLWLSICGGSLCALTLLLLVVVFRERQGRPLFKSIPLLGERDGKVIQET